MTTQINSKPIVAKVGTIGKEPTMGQGQKTNWCRFSIAVETPVTPGDFQGEKHTDWYEISCFGSVADHAAESFAKGDRILVIGKGETDTWVGRDNKERTTKRIIADAIGPDVRFNSVQINRIAKQSSSDRGPRAQSVSDDLEF